MSVTQWWLHVAVTPVQLARLKPAYDASIAAASVEAAEVFDRWQRLEDDIKWDRKVNAFQAAFNLRPIRSFCDATILRANHELELTEDTVIDLTANSGITPVSVFCYAVGEKVTRSLPGLFGNILLSNVEVPVVLQQLTAMMSKEYRDAQIVRGTSLCKLGHYPCEYDVAQFLESWPAALRIAAERDTGLLSVSIQAP